MIDNTQKNWNEYWAESTDQKGLFALIARFYRRQIISRAVRHYFHKYFIDEKDKFYLHAGCGSAESDSRIGFKYSNMILLDLSKEALKLVKKRSGYQNAYLICADLFHLPLKPESMDGLWNLGVMEHFYPPEIHAINLEFGRVLKPGGIFMLLWPPVYGLTVMGLGAILIFTNKILRCNYQFFPDEVSYFVSKKWAKKNFNHTGLSIEKVHFSFRDLYTYAFLTGKKRS